MSDISSIPVESQPRLAHHFDDVEQQHEANTFGMWVFLATEVLFFGALFMAYTIFRAMYPEAFAAASHHLNITLGTINTFVLLTSSLAVVLGVYYVRNDRKSTAVLLFLITLLLGTIFLGIKAVEWITDWREGLIPGLNWALTGPEAKGQELFFVLYFTMTGLHALHMIIGMGVFTVITLMLIRRRHVSRMYTNVEMVGLYWHFVDIVWVFLFPLLYLIDLHK